MRLKYAATSLCEDYRPGKRFWQLSDMSCRAKAPVFISPQIPNGTYERQLFPQGWCREESLKPAPFGYHDPTTVEEAVALYDRLENARPLAGGQSLVPMMNFRYAVPDHLIDLNGVAELSGVSFGSRVSIGAMTRQRDLEFSDEVARRCPIFREAVLNVGHRQTRNRGTIGGSLCHLDPSAEMSAMMMLHDATLTARTVKGERRIPFADFALGFMTTALEPNELLTRIEFDAWPEGHGFAFEEYARRHGDFAIASAGVLLTLDERGLVQRLAVVVGGVDTVPVRLRDVEKSTIGSPLSQDLSAAVADAAGKLGGTDDAHVSADYRRHLATVLVTRALRRAAKTPHLQGALHV
jgi:carbon-monoxide dehydrogenase medium subunit